MNFQQRKINSARVLLLRYLVKRNICRSLRTKTGNQNIIWIITVCR